MRSTRPCRWTRPGRTARAGAGRRHAHTLALATQPDAREGDLRAVDEPTLAHTLAGVPYVLGAEAEAEPEHAAATGDGSLAQALLWALLACAVAESLVARWLGTPREARA